VSSSASTPPSGDRVALDTSVIAIDVLAAKADSRLVAGVTEHLLPVPVVGELRYGALNSRKAAENLAKVEALVARCVILDITVATAQVYAKLRLALRQKGKPIPENDLWIAALCVERQVSLAALDAHFDAIDELRRWPRDASHSEVDAR
jgi:tRNA(fMet)-specific endonuclease VapC